MCTHPVRHRSQPSRHPGQRPTQLERPHRFARRSRRLPMVELHHLIARIGPSCSHLRAHRQRILCGDRYRQRLHGYQCLRLRGQCGIGRGRIQCPIDLPTASLHRTAVAVYGCTSVERPNSGPSGFAGRCGGRTTGSIGRKSFEHSGVARRSVRIAVRQCDLPSCGGIDVFEMIDIGSTSL